MLLEEKMASKDITNAICTKVREEAAIVGWKNKRRKIFDKCKIRRYKIILAAIILGKKITTSNSRHLVLSARIVTTATFLMQSQNTYGQQSN